MNKLRKSKANYMKDVIVVGAGAAGLGAAHQLVKHGIKDIAILEAANRIGGRVHTIQFGTTAEKNVELGANWIHGGSLSNPIYALALKHQFLKEVPHWNRFERSHFLKTGGNLIDPVISKQAVDIFFEEDKAMMKLWSEKSTEYGQLDVLSNLNSRLLQRLDKDFKTHQEKDARLVFNTLLSYLRVHVGDELQKVSALYYGTYKEIPGGDIIVPHGFQSLIKALANELPSNCIHTNHNVSKIEWNALKTYSTLPNSHPIRIMCQNGIIWQAKHAIVTISLGCLKKYHQDLFQPELPRFKVEAIENIGFGCTNKIFMEFEQELQMKYIGHIIPAWTEDELSESENEFPIAWERSIFSFDEVYENPKVLVGWVAGDRARHMENLTDQQVANMCIYVLKRFTGNALIPPIKRITRSKWSSDPLILGSYSYASMKSGTKEVEWLSQPLPSADQPQLLFCGEATHPNYYSTVHGAFLSGIREANNIIKLNQCNSKM